MAKKSDYFGIDRTISLILAIIPFTAWLCGVITRIQEEQYLAAVVRVFLGWIVWVLDLIFMIKDGCICRLLDMRK